MTHETEGSAVVNYFSQDDGVAAVAEVAEGWTACLRWELVDGRLELVSLQIGRSVDPLALGAPFDQAAPSDVEEGHVARFATTHWWPSRRLAARAPEADLTIRLLRSLPIGRFEEQAREHLAGEGKIGPEFDLSKIPSDLSEAASRRPGRRGRDDGFYAEVAAQYVQALRDGIREPVPHVATQLHLSVSQTRNHLVEARRRGLLTKPRPGRAEGELTEAGLRALNEEGT